MIISEADKKKLAELAKKHPVISRMLDEIESFTADPAKIFYKEATEIIKVLCKEMRDVRNGVENETPTLLGSKDKLFERVKSLLTDSEKIFAGLRKGRMDIDPNYKQKEDNNGEVIL